jgi:PAS domain S-box-containing protein
VHPDDAASTITAWNAAVANKETFYFEHRLRQRDGEWRRYSIRAIPIFDVAGEIREWVGVHTDITAREAAAAALRASEARLRAVFDQAAAGFARTDLTGRFQQVNDRYCTIVGRSSNELLTLRMQDITHPDDLVSNAPLFERTAAGGSSFEIEKRYVRPDGVAVWVRNSVSAVREDGAEEAMLAVAIDISDRKRAEEALRELNDTLERQVSERTAERDQMWNTSPDLMLIIDFQGYFRRVNPAWTALLGYTPDELLDHHVNEFVLPEDHAPTVDAYELAAEGGRPSIVNRYRHKDGSTRWISWAAAPAGEMTYATGRDVTAEHRRETELAAAQEALRQSQKMEAMGQLTGGVAHDFNNLLTPIIGSLDMLVRRGVGSERERRLVDGALQSAERAKTLVQRLLAFARRQPLQPVSVEVSKLVEGMVGLISSTLGPTIDLRVALASDVPLAKADVNQLEMALLNLAVNARDAMPAGGELTIEAKGESLNRSHASGLTPGEYVLLRVADTGVGMDRETLRQAVEPFFSTKGVGKGTGLGLSMVHGLTAQLGGGMTIDSAPGKGTAIELWLPVSTGPASLHGVISSLPTAQAGRGVALLVDDEPLVRMSTADMLIDLGFEVIEAGTGEDALRLIKSDVAPDLLVTDHLMPGMTGAELAREVRLIKPELPILVVSGYAEVDGIAPELARLTKPFRNADLAASIAALVP